jgi:peroxiredoxin
MSASGRESVVSLLGDLHAERLRTWEPAQLKVNVDQRQTLVEAARAKRFVQAGDAVEDFTLQDVEGGELTRDALLADGPLVLVFFRFAGCPACNIAIPHYNRALAPELKRLGARLVAVSPQVPEKLVDIKRRHELSFDVASDIGNELGRRFGILYEFDEASRASALKAGRGIGDVTGTGTWELPQPAIVVIDRDATVRFADVSPDWMVRTEAEPVLAAVRQLSLDKAA